MKNSHLFNLGQHSMRVSNVKFGTDDEPTVVTFHYLYELEGIVESQSFNVHLFPEADRCSLNDVVRTGNEIMIVRLEKLLELTKANMKDLNNTEKE